MISKTCMFKIILIVYADDIVIFANSADVLQISLNLLNITVVVGGLK